MVARAYWKGGRGSEFGDRICSLGKEIRKDSGENLDVFVRKNPLFQKR